VRALRWGADVAVWVWLAIIGIDCVIYVIF